MEPTYTRHVLRSKEVQCRGEQLVESVKSFGSLLLFLFSLIDFGDKRQVNAATRDGHGGIVPKASGLGVLAFIAPCA